MRDHWLDDHVGPEASMRDGFEDELARTLSAQWQGDVAQGRMRLQHDDASPSRSWGKRLGWIAVAAAVIAALVVVITVRRPDGDRNAPISSTPAVPATSVASPTLAGPVVSANGQATTRPAVVVTPATASVAPTTASVLATAPSTTPATTTPATTTPSTTSASTAPPTAASIPLTFEHALAIAANRGDVVDPTVIATVPVGSGAGTLMPQNAEFDTLIAVTADSIVLPEYDFGAGALTGRAVVLDRSGTYRHDLQIEGGAGVQALWVGGAPNGTIFIVSSVSGGVDFHIVAYTLSGDVYKAVKTADVPLNESATFDITSRGLEQGQQVDMAIATGVDPAPVTAEFVTPQPPNTTNDLNTAQIKLVRGVAPATTTWSIDLQLDAVDPPLDDIVRVGLFGTGAWLTEFTSGGTGGAFLAVLSPTAGQSHSYRFGAWSLGASDARQLVFTQVTSNGIVIAVLDAPA